MDRGSHLFPWGVGSRFHLLLSSNVPSLYQIQGSQRVLSPACISGLWVKEGVAAHPRGPASAWCPGTRSRQDSGPQTPALGGDALQKT